MNRAVFREAVEQAIHSTLAVLYVDLDNFKPVNDEYGHAAGDKVLVTVAARLTEATRPDDVVARLGGDEFALLLRGSPRHTDARPVAERLLAALAVSIELGGCNTAQVGASIGIACAPAGTVSAGEVLRNADIAMYSAKRRGRSRAVTFDPHEITHRVATAVAEGTV